MPITTLNLIKGDKTSTDTDYRDALPVNMYGVIREIFGAQGYMLCYPGLTKFGTGDGVDRAGNYNDRFEKHFRVSGTSLVEISTGGVSTTLGDVSGSYQASMPYSFNTQAVITDGKMFLYDPTSGFRQVTDGDLGSPIDGVWVDGYYFLTDGEYIYHTDITDEEAIDPLKFATAEFMPDPSIAVAKTQDNKVIVFGRYSIEYFINAANDNFAFSRVATRAQKIGIVATHAKCEAGGNFYITGGRKEGSIGVYVLGIGSSEKVSSREVDKILSQYSEPELFNMRMESRMEDNVAFVLVHLPNETLCFNETVAKTFGVDVGWSILKSDVRGDTPYRGINGIFEARTGRWIYGDKQSSYLGYLDNTVFTHYEDMVEWILFTPLINLGNASISKIEIETIPGHTTSLDAKIGVSLTYNGLTYGTEYFEMYGEPLDYGKNFIVRRLGFIGGFFGCKLRGATIARMALGTMKVTHG